MKTKLFGVFTACVLSQGVANAVTLTTNIFANTSVGLITTLISGTRLGVTGSAYLYSSTTQIAGDLSSVRTLEDFQALMTTDTLAVVGRQNLTVTNGALSSTGTAELGAVGSNVYLWIQSGDGNSYGLYQGADIPSLGTYTITPAGTSDLIGTSVFAAASAPNVVSGYQLAFVPEPSAALLGALGALGLLRRRRI